MFKNLHSVIFLLILFKNIQNSKIVKICVIKEKECKGSYDPYKKYKTFCENSPCSGAYKTNCGLNYCSFNEESCEYFQNYKILVNLIQIYDKSNQYSRILDNIEACPIKKYVWNPNHACAKSKVCTKKILILMRSGLIRFHKMSSCNCGANCTYACGKDFCTINQKSCNQIMGKEVALSKEIKPCILNQ